ncbi:hypothetical protein [Magnetospirillum gryphiswaldense]|uniref:DUF1269 domain-containing protein n=1 Tax=Magnetospirillum gryphiswaldense TaxID=55518 RepID=A4U0J0_9PROT|nr:hypothetical protein [Magnetospirillum gryphiswaldense]AVM75361.1 hypothetical protein MSR1_28930 [Magnetospirillum gryphiswaldense MSR-1]AVM79264.1 hypothetical protein MSR1L_28930 [Magnetospirillum gryphiswaldense]CAM76397.1 conserved hypothetical protein [Magnetospirillum gryphiswaldense MSR-1]
MDAYRHHVSGFFAHREEAESASSRLVEQGLPRTRLQIFDAGQAPPAPTPLADNNDVLKDVVVDGTIGAAVGTGIAALAELALVAASVSLFVASPLVAPLVMLGWGASLGALVGASVGASPGNDERKDGRLSDLVSDAIASGQVVLVAETRTEAETLVARNVIRASVGDCKDLNVAEKRTEL